MRHIVYVIPAMFTDQTKSSNPFINQANRGEDATVINDYHKYNSYIMQVIWH